MSLNGLIRSQSLSTSLMPWSTFTLKKHPTHQHRPNTKRKVRRDGNLSLMIDSGLVQTCINIPIRYQYRVVYFTRLSMVRQLQNEANVSDAVPNGEKVANLFRNSLPNGRHAKMSSQVKTMEQFKRCMKVCKKTPFDSQTTFLRLRMVGQKRQLLLAPIFLYEFCTVPPSLIDEYGCIRKGNKSILASWLGLKQDSAPNSDTVIVDMQYMLYHIVWPHGGDASDLSENIKRRLSYRA